MGAPSLAARELLARQATNHNAAPVFPGSMKKPRAARPAYGSDQPAVAEVSGRNDRPATGVKVRAYLNRPGRKMPREGSLVLSEVQTPFLHVICSACEWRGTYKVEALIRAHGDAKLTDLLPTLVACPKASAVSVHDRCKALFKELQVREIASGRESPNRVARLSCP